MAANIETMAYFGSKPWHGLGVEVLQLMTAEECLQKAGLDWTVEKRELMTVDGIPVPGHFATVRTSDNYPLGVVGNIYSPVQNVEALDFMDALSKSGEAKYETAGSLQHGKLVWIMAKIPNGSGVDPVEPYLLLATSHDGTSPVMATATDVRVVCNNTLNAALKGAKNKFRIRHTTNWADKIAEARKTLAGSLQYFEKAHALYDKMKGEKLTQEQLEKVILKVFKGTADTEDLTERQVKSYDTLVEEITALTYKGMGVDLPGVKGTAWGGYNAITEFLDHRSEVKGRKAASEAEATMSSIWFGTIAEKNQLALDNILEMVKLAA